MTLRVIILLTTKDRKDASDIQKYNGPKTKPTDVATNCPEVPSYAPPEYNVDSHLHG